LRVSKSSRRTGPEHVGRLVPVKARTLACAVVLVTLVSCLSDPAGSLASKGDHTATHTYIEADYALLRTVHANIHPSELAVAQFIHSIEGECPKAAEESPQNKESEALTNEIGDALSLILYHSNSVAVAHFVQSIKSLHWSNHKLTHIADKYAKSLSELSTLPAPNICADVQSWTASGFQTVPASTTQFDQHLEAIEAQAVSPKLLARYEKPSDKALALRMTRLETQLDRDESSLGYSDWTTILEALGLAE
jgi:hypothetical protein